MDRVPLKDYFESKMREQEIARRVAFDSMEKRLESMNEFRDTLRDQASRFITRDELNAIVSKLDADIEVLKTSKAQLEGAASQGSVYMATGIAITGLIIGIARFFFN